LFGLAVRELIGARSIVLTAPIDDDSRLISPGSGRGLIDVFRRRYLLSLIVRKEVGIRYRGSVLGWLWSYVKPLVQFVVFFVALGVFLGLNKSIEYYPIYLLAGITVVSFFNEAFSNATRSLVDNAPLIKKIYLPREMFPIASVLVAAVNVLPQILVVFAISLLFGWTPGVLQIAALLLALVIIAILATGLGLLFGAVNVTFRDAQSFVDIIVMVSIWASPVMYQWQMVAETAPLWLFPDLWLFALSALGSSMLILVAGQLVFRRLEVRFAQDL
jgi:ABC-2 type transport system permease protein